METKKDKIDKGKQTETNRQEEQSIETKRQTHKHRQTETWKCGNRQIETEIETERQKQWSVQTEKLTEWTAGLYSECFSKALCAESHYRSMTQMNVTLA